MEDSVFKTSSKQNSHEASFMIKLAEYFVFMQHYKPSQITILTPYLGQKRTIKELLQACDDKRKGSTVPGAKRLAPMSAEAEELAAEAEERFTPAEKAKDKEKKDAEDDNAKVYSTHVP
jgi:hypothetical protein